MKNTKKDNRPYWKDTASIQAAGRLAKRTTNYINATILPLCRWCGLSVKEEDAKRYFADSKADFAPIEEAFVEATISKVEAQFGKVVDYLGEQVKTEAKTKFAGFLERISGVKPPKAFESYYTLSGMQSLYFEDIAGAIHLNESKGEMFVNFAEIEQQYTHYLGESETAEFERQQQAADALNSFFRGRADWKLIQGAFFIVEGEVLPSTEFNYKLLK